MHFPLSTPTEIATDNGDMIFYVAQNNSLLVRETDKDGLSTLVQTRVATMLYVEGLRADLLAEDSTNLVSTAARLVT